MTQLNFDCLLSTSVCLLLSRTTCYVSKHIRIPRLRLRSTLPTIRQGIYNLIRTGQAGSINDGSDRILELH
jgi:hypothetical protein